MSAGGGASARGVEGCEEGGVAVRMGARNCALKLHRLCCGAGSISGLGGRGREVTVSAVGKAGARGLEEREREVSL